ncbi:hypothetical protein [Ascidiimonas sp. W6]|uniref:hypothetical protein n=1 Tax=Ascidiimonas meishanensis TaxID=3128903 RepID=UPI0030EC65BA
MTEEQDASNDFKLECTEGISFSTSLNQEKKDYSQEHEKVITDWAYQASVTNGDVFDFTQEIAKRLLAVYDAYITMQMQFDIAPVFDLEMARTFKRTMGMTHQGILKLQELAKSPEFLVFSKEMASMNDTERKELWETLIAVRNSSNSGSEVDNIKKENPQHTKAIDTFLSIPKGLRNFDELTYVKVDKLSLLVDYAEREIRLSRTLFPSSYHKRRWKSQDKRDRVLTEINQRNGSFASEEFTKSKFGKAATYKAGEIGGVLSLLFHVDPNLSHIKNGKQREEALARKEKTSNDALFRAVMTFMPSQHFLMNEIYKLPKTQFEALNKILKEKHDFTLDSDQDALIQTSLESGGGAYAVFSNNNIRKSKTEQEKKAHYASLEETAEARLYGTLKNLSKLEKLGIKNIERAHGATHLFRGGDIFSVPLNARQVWSADKKAKEYMLYAEQKGYPVACGISGTTSRNFALAYALGLLKNQKNQSHLLTACIGFMVPLKHHSIYEMVTTLKSFNFPFKHSLGLVKGIEDFTKIPNFSRDIQEKVSRIHDEQNKAKSKKNSEIKRKKAGQSGVRR